MAAFAVAVAVSVAITVATRLLFPPKTIDSRAAGPQLSDLAVSSASYGKPINRGYGTARMAGNMIWSTGLIETASTETQTAGGKGGGSSTSSFTTYSYNASFAMAFSEGVAADLLRIWADGKLVYDKTGSGLAVSSGLKFTFYHGDENQLPDPLIEADKGVGNVPGHRGMCYMVAELWPLANFGNRLPSITAEIAYSGITTLPFTGLAESAGLNVPGSSSGADSDSHMYLDPFSDNLYFMKNDPTGISRQSIGSLSNQVISPVADGLHSHSVRYCMNDKIYVQAGGSNWEPFTEIEPIGMRATGFTFGIDSSIGTWGSPLHFRNGSHIGVLRVGKPELGLDYRDFFVIGGDHIRDGFVIVYSDGGVLVQQNHITDTGIGRAGHIIQDFFNKRIFSVQQNNTTLDIYEITAAIDLGLTGPTIGAPSIRLVGTYAKGGVDLTGTNDIAGWCVLPTEEALILSNTVSMLKIDMDTGAILAKNLDLGFRSEDQWTDTGRFGFGNGHSGGLDGGILYVIDTDSLLPTITTNLTSSSFSDSFESNYPKAAWDPRADALVFSRQHGVTPDSATRIVRVLMGRVEGLPVDLDVIVADVCSDAGLLPSEFDVTALSTESVLGYVISRQTSGRAAIEPLQKAYMFEGFESDWQLKFALRGGAPVLTIAETDVGRLDTGDEEFVKETRIQEVEMPEVIEVFYADKEKDYQQGVQQDKRVTLPTPSQHARNTLGIDLPIVFLPTGAKQLAQRWLYTTWSERLSLQSTLPWRYIRLDPSDIVNMNYRGDVRRLRMAQLEIGTGFDIDFISNQEDAESNTSNIDGDGGDGFTGQVIPSGLPSRLHLLDLPLLFTADTSLQQFSRAYWAVSGYDDTWGGAQLVASLDNGSTFVEAGIATLESSWGFVLGTIPDPESTETWDESATIDVQVARGIGQFATSTDLQVLSGANALAVTKADGTTEIIQFVTVTPLTTNSVRLSRLLRGRRGTEQDAFGHSVSEQCVLLEPGRTMAFQLPLTMIDIVGTYRAVTLDTLLEDAVIVNKTYTGRDLQPYSPSHITGVFGAGRDVDLDWFRRTRYNGGLADGTDDVPLNETIEQYEVDILESVGGTVLRTLVVNNATQVSYDMDLDFGTDATILAPFDTDANDDSALAATGTVGSEAVIQTRRVRTGAGSLELSPSASVNPSNAFVSYPDLAAYTLTGAFTIEANIRFKSLTFPSDTMVIASHYNNTGAQRAWYFRYSGSLNELQFFPSQDGSTGTTRRATFNPVIGQWYHVAVTRDSLGVIRLFIDGVLTGTDTTLVGALFDSSETPYIGKLRSTGFDDQPFNGFIDNFRMVNGVAAYTENFAPAEKGLTVDTIPGTLNIEVFQMSALGVVGRGEGQAASIPLLEDL